MLGGVLAREGRDLMPLVDVHLDRDERRALDRELLRDVTVDRAPFSLAWLCDLLDDEEQAYVLGAASGASRLVYRSPTAGVPALGRGRVRRRLNAPGRTVRLARARPGDRARSSLPWGGDARPHALRVRVQAPPRRARRADRR